MNEKLTDPDALLQKVASRADVLECLYNGVSDSRVIEERIGVSRMTIYRALQELREFGLVAGENPPRLTLVGKLAYEQYKQVDQGLSNLIEVTPLLGHLSPDVELGPRVLNEAEVCLPQGGAPHDPVLRLEKLVQEAESKELKGFSPVVLPAYVRFFHKQIVERGFEAEFVVAFRPIEYLLVHHMREMTEVMETGRCTFYKLSGVKIPYGVVTVVGEGIWIGIYDSDEMLRGAIINKSPAAIRWGLEQYDHFQEQAELLDQKDLLLRGPRPYSAPSTKEVER